MRSRWTRELLYWYVRPDAAAYAADTGAHAAHAAHAAHSGPDASAGVPLRREHEHVQARRRGHAAVGTLSLDVRLQVR